MLGEVTEGLFWILGGSKDSGLETVRPGDIRGLPSPCWTPALSMIDSISSSHPPPPDVSRSRNPNALGPPPPAGGIPF